MIGVATIVVDLDCDNCGWGYNNRIFVTIVVGVATIVVDCNNCEHCDNCDRITNTKIQSFIYLERFSGMCTTNKNNPL